MRMPRAKLEGGITEFCMAIRTLSVWRKASSSVQANRAFTGLINAVQPLMRCCYGNHCMHTQDQCREVGANGSCEQSTSQFIAL